MKAGTTSLFHDLNAHPNIFLPADKEPHNLCRNEVLAEKGRARYARIYTPALASQICGDASTGYSKLPDLVGVVNRACAVLGKDIKVIYLVREPVARIVSQHHHDCTPGYYASRAMTGRIDNDLHIAPELINYSRYAMQIDPWINAFGRDHVAIIAFEEYIASRRQIVDQLLDFIGISNAGCEIDTEAVHNANENRLSVGPIWGRVQRSLAYRRLLRPFLSSQVRSMLKQRVVPKAPPRPAPPKPETVDFILETLAPDMEQLRVILGKTEPVWDIGELRAKWHERYARWEAMHTNDPTCDAMAPQGINK